MRTAVLLALVFLIATPSFAKIRHYYIAAEDVSWDFAPSGHNLIEGGLIPRPWAGHTKWPKTRFIEYTDNTFSVRKPQPEWLGILGPIIRAEVGDEVVVDFLNRTDSGHDMHPHGLHYDKDNEGSYYIPGGRGSMVGPNNRFTYHWFADADSGPGPGQPSSIVWWYHAHVNEPMETNAGLMGPIIVTAKGKAKPDGSPIDVDREFVTSFVIFDQMGTNPDGQFYSINGYIFGNLPGLVMKNGERVRWYLMAMGNEQDLHTPHWHGKVVNYGNEHVDVIELLPGSTRTVDMLADNPGIWMFHCHVGDHMESGMMTTYTIYEPRKDSCPIQFISGDFYGNSGKYKLQVKNTSGKAIKHLGLQFEHFLAPQYLHLPNENDWISTQSIPTGQVSTLEKDAYLPGTLPILGWAIFPVRIMYEDGSTWTGNRGAGCFQVYWRDKDHPKLEILPPHQVEKEAD